MTLQLVISSPLIHALGNTSEAPTGIWNEVHSLRDRWLTNWAIPPYTCWHYPSYGMLVRLYTCWYNPSYGMLARLYTCWYNPSYNMLARLYTCWYNPFYGMLARLYTCWYKPSYIQLTRLTVVYMLIQAIVQLADWAYCSIYVGTSHPTVGWPGLQWYICWYKPSYSWLTRLTVVYMFIQAILQLADWAYNSIYVHTGHPTVGWLGLQWYICWYKPSYSWLTGLTVVYMLIQAILQLADWAYNSIYVDTSHPTVGWPGLQWYICWYKPANSWLTRLTVVYMLIQAILQLPNWAYSSIYVHTGHPTVGWLDLQWYICWYKPSYSWLTGLTVVYMLIQAILQLADQAYSGIYVDTSHPTVGWPGLQ